MVLTGRTILHSEMTFYLKNYGIILTHARIHQRLTFCIVKQASTYHSQNNDDPENFECCIDLEKLIPSKC